MITPYTFFESYLKKSNLDTRQWENLHNFSSAHSVNVSSILYLQVLHNMAIVISTIWTSTSGKDKTSISTPL